MNDKPLRGAAYGSIPHLPGSKFGSREDRGVPIGEAKLFTDPIYSQKAKSRSHSQDYVVVTEKMDGSSVAVAKIDDEIIPLIKAGYRAQSARYDQHHIFYSWAMSNYAKFNALLDNWEWVCGELMVQAHGTIYSELESPFYVFDLFSRGRRVPYRELVPRVRNVGLTMVPILHEGEPISIDYAMEILGEHGRAGADLSEGAVWRRETIDGKVYLAKFVRPEKNIGRYLKLKEPIWMWKI